MHRVLVILLAVAVVCNRGARAGELSIAAASDLVFCLDDLHRAFAKVHPDITLKATTGASGNIFAQINNGAPFHVIGTDGGLLERAIVAEEAFLA
jgi:molybdate transport system substrate-binding protein